MNKDGSSRYRNRSLRNASFVTRVATRSTLLLFAASLPLRASTEMLVGFGANNHGEINVPLTTNEIRSFDAGYNHSVAVGDFGTAAWGQNVSAEGTAQIQSTNALQVSAGFRHNLVLSSNGVVVGWGANDFGQTNVPDVATNIVQVSAGGFHSLALSIDGGVLAWGQGTYGQVTVPAAATNVVAVAAGAYHCVALRADGKAVAWGNNGNGQRTVPIGLNDAARIASGFFHNLAVRSNGTVVAWGWNQFGQCNIPSELSNVVAVAAGYRHSVALRSDGRVVTWGDNSAGQWVGTNDAANVTGIAAGADFTLIRASGPIVTRQPTGMVIVPGTNYTLEAQAVAVSSLTYQWQRDGIDIPGAIGSSLTLTNLQTSGAGSYRARISTGSTILYTRDARLTFAPVITQQPQALDVYYGSNAVLTVIATAFPAPSYQWYFNGNVLAGRTNSTLVLSNATYASIGDYRVVISNEVAAVSSQSAHLYVQTAPLFGFGGQMTIPFDGAVLIQTSQAGVLGDSYQWQYEGHDIPGATNTYIQLTNARPSLAGRYRYASITEAGALYSPDLNVSVDRANPVNFAGRQFQIEAGNGLGLVTGWQWLHSGTNIPNATNATLTLNSIALNDAGDYSVVVSGPSAPRELPAAKLTVLAEPTPGYLRLWGTPPAFSNVEDSIAVSTGARHALILRADGSVSGFGDNGCGGITIPAALSNCVSVAAGEYNSMGLRNDGRVLFFGNCSCTACGFTIERAVKISMGTWHGLAVLNDETVAFAGEGTPPPAGLTNVVDVAAGYEHSVALKSDGTVVAWGNNDRGQLNIPAGLNSVKVIAAGNYHNLALRNDGTVVAWGLNASGQCNVPSDLNGVAAIRAGPGHSLAIRTNGTVVAWGDNTFGQSTVPGDITNAVAADGATAFSAAIIGDLSRPAILRHPLSTTNDVGSTAVFSVVARSTAPLAYQWQFGGVPISGATNDTLVLTNITPQMQGSYSVLVSTPNATVTSRAAFLFVVPAPFLPLPNGIAGRVVAWGRNVYGETNVPAELTNAVAIASGSTALESFAFKVDGTLLRWGGIIAVPSDVTNVVAVCGGNNFDLALRNNGMVSIWGSPDYTSILPGISGVRAISAGGPKIGLLTNGTVLDLAGYGFLAGVSNAVAIAVGGGHALALKQDGTIALQAYAYPNSEQTPVPAGLSNVVAIAAGDNHSVALRADGTVTAWGRNAESQCSAPPNLSNVIAIAAAGNHSLALKADHTVVSWGDDAYGLNKIPAGLTNVIAIAAGWQHNIALRAGPVFIETPTNTLAAIGSNVTFAAKAVAGGPVSYCWFLNGVPIADATNATLLITNAQPVAAGDYTVVAQADGFSASATASLGFGTAPLVITGPEPVWALLGSTVSFQVSATNQRPLLYQWFQDGQVLLGETNSSLSITNVQLDQSGTYSVRIRTDWGIETNASANLYVLLDRPMGRVVAWGTNAAVPADISGVVAIAAGDDHSVALRADGTVVAWGMNDYGQTNVPATLSNVIAVAAGGRHCLALKRDGTMVGWGHNYNGQASPPGIAGVRAIAGGNSFSTAVTAGGEIIAWGNGYGGAVATPVDVTNATSVAAGQYHGIALRADGTVSGWGDDQYGEATGPMSVSHVTAVAAGHCNSIVLKDNGTVVAFGINFANQTNVPPGVSKVVSIATQYGRCLVAKSDGTVQGWGLNDRGQTIPPFALTNIVQVAAGMYHSLALEETGCYIVHPLRNTNVLAGIDVTFQVTAVGVSPLRYQWACNGADIASATNRSLLLSAVQLTNAGVYTVRIASTRGTDSSSATLSVYSPPMIVSPPQDQSVVVGGTAAFSVAVGGTAPVRIFWQRSGVNIAGATNTTLTLTNVSVTQAGSYRVIATNAYGIVTSASAMLVVNEPPRIVQPPHEQITAVGSDATFNVLAAGTQPLFFQWKKNGQPLFGETNSVLVLAAVQTNNAGTFVVEITNSFGATTSAPVTLAIVPQAPTILQQPLSSDIQLGASGNVSVVAVGTNPLQYQWQLNGTDLPGATTNSLVLPSFSFSQQGDYRVRVWNAFGSVWSDPATLRLRLPPNVVAWGSNQLGQLSVPVDLTNATAIAAGFNHSLAIRENSTVAAWGSNAAGQCDVPSGLSNVVAVSAGTSHSLALLNDGTVVGWGATNSSFGEATPPAGLTNVVAIEAASSYSLVLLKNGTVSGWGYAASGARTPPAGLSNVVAITAGAEHAVALLSDHTVVGWGNYYGEPTGLTNVVAIGSSLFEFMALRDDGRIVSWTLGNYGQTKFAGPTNAIAISGGGSSVNTSKPHFIGVLSNGTASIWGDNPANVFSPPPGLSNVTAVAAGFAHNVALVRTPLILRDPTSQNVDEGQPLSLSVLVARAEAAQYQWTQNGIDIPGATNDTFILNQVVFANSGLYTVRVFNAFGSVTSAPATVTVIPIMPMIVQQPTAASVSEGGSASFNVSALGAPPLSYRWLFNGSTIPNAVSASLVISNVTSAQCGVYSVVVGNHSGFAVSSNAVLTLMSPEIILDNPTAVVIGSWTNTVAAQNYGSNSLAAMQGLGDATVQYSASVPRSGNYRLYEWHPSTANRSASVPLAVTAANGITWLNLNQTTLAGVWLPLGTFQFNTGAPARLAIYDSCPEAGRVVIADAFRLVLVPNPPVIVSQPSSQTVDCGMAAVFSVQVTGTDPFTFQWRKNGVNIDAATNSTLELAAVALWDAGTYSLLVANADGTAVSQSAQLTVSAPRLITYPSQGSLVIEWNGPGILQSSTNVAGPYVDVPDAVSPIVVDFGEPQRYFRMRLSGSGSGPALQLKSGSLTWSATATLQSATNVAGPYVDIPVATSPFPIDLNDEAHRFFRLKY